MTVSLSDKLIEEYHERGLLRVKLPSSVVGLCGEFLTEASAWLKAMGGINVAPDKLSAELPAIAVKDRTMVAKLYKVSRRFASAKRIASDRALTDISAKLMGIPMASCCHFVNVRIDLPAEEKYLLPPHQDFPYIQGSLNAVTWWIPFTDTPIKVGPPSYIPGSHKLGVCKVKEFGYEATGKSGGKSFQIDDIAQFENAAYVHEDVPFGEALVFDTLLVHRSEPNQTNLARINVQVRFDDPFSKDSYNRNYPEGLYLGDEFAKNYPEYVTK